MPEQLAHGRSEPAPELAVRRVDALSSRVVPLAPRKFGFQFTGDQETHELYEDVRALLSKEIPSGEMALVLKETLRIAKAQLMKRKFAATDRPGRARGSADARHIPAAVKREVHERDQGRCTFVSDGGHRCGSRRFLEFDHEVPVARGGGATVENIRLRCCAHNQHLAERVFGAEFMDNKQRERRAAAAAGRPVGPS